MAGHYSMPNDAGGTSYHNNYERILSIYRKAAATHNHIEHLDWHEATKMDDIAAYAARYYPAVTNLNQTAGTYTGDFIHPNALGHAEAQQLLTRMLTMPNPTRLGSAALEEDLMRKLPLYSNYSPQKSLVATKSFTVTNTDGTTDTFTTSTAHGMAVGNRVAFTNSVPGVANMNPGRVLWVAEVPTSTTFKVSLTSGGTVVDLAGGSTSQTSVRLLEDRKYAIPAGSAIMACESAGSTVEVPFYRDTSLAANRLQGIVNAIDAATTRDEFGAYVEYTTLQNTGLGQEFTDASLEGILTIRASGSIQVRSNALTVVNPYGDVIGTSVSVSRSSVSEPIVIAMRLRATASNQFVSLQGRIYEATLTMGTVPVLI